MTEAEARDLAWQDYEREWHRCWPWLKAALDRSPIPAFDKEHIWQEVKEGRAVLWPLPGAACLTQITTYPTGVKALTIWLAGGDLGQLQNLCPRLEAYGRDHGCTWSMICGRAGWARALNGYQQATVMLCKGLVE